MSPILGARGGLSASAYGFTSAVAVANSFESIQTITVTSNTSSITFSSIPSTYKDLHIRMVTRTDQFSVPGLRIRFNSDTASNYSTHRLVGNRSSVFSQNASGTNISIYGPGAFGTNLVGVNIIDILDYASTNKFKTLRCLAGNENNTSSVNVALFSGNWRNSGTAINSIYMECDTLFVANSYFALYGIKG
jgi:hypothetical protein